MDGSKVNKNARTIDLKANSNREFFLIHGYTGSPTDFNNLGKYLHDRFNANVKIIRLVGHGEKIESLDELEYKDFLTHAERELKKDIAKRRKIIIGGLSVGGFIAMQLASKYPVKGVIGISLPFEGRVMTKIITFIEPLIVKKYWKKPASKKEIQMRKNAFFYSASLLGLRVIKRGKKEVEGKLKGIKAPCLIIHVLNDKIFSVKGAYHIGRIISSKTKEVALLNHKNRINHNPFYSDKHKEIYKIIGDFVEKHRLF